MKWSFLRLCLCAFPLLFATTTEAGEKENAEAALAIARARAVPTVPASDCHADLPAARAEAVRSGKRLVLWVGMTCEDMPAVRRALADCVHCHQPAINGSAVPRVIVPDGRGDTWSIPRDSLTPQRALETMRHGGACPRGGGAGCDCGCLDGEPCRCLRPGVPLSYAPVPVFGRACSS